MGKQYLYVASVGIVGAAVAAVRAAPLSQQQPPAVALVGILLVLAYGARSVARNRDWHNDLASNLATVAESPRSAALHKNLGNSHFSRGELSLAAWEYRTALELNPASYKAHFNSGNLAPARDRLDEAEAACRCAIALRPDYFDPYYNLAFVTHRQGRRDEEIGWLERAVALQPGHADAHLNLGVALVPVDPVRAARHLRRFVALAPEHPQATAVRARLLSLSPPAGIEGRGNPPAPS